MKATVRCLADGGYHVLSTRRVARQARVSLGILHYYFRDKRELLRAAFKAAADRMDRRVAAEAREANDALEQLRAIVRGAVKFSDSEPECWCVMLDFWAQAQRDPDLAEVNRQLYARSRRLIRAVVERGIRAGQLRPVKPATAAALVVGLIDGLCLQRAFDRGSLSAMAASRAAEDALVSYLRPSR